MGSADTQQVGARLAWFLSGAYPGTSKRKRIARDFGVSPDTAKAWLSGTRPRKEHFDRMVSFFGPAFLKFIYPSTDELHDLLDRLHEEVKDIRNILRGDDAR
jgi:hypothetical protein